MSSSSFPASSPEERYPYLTSYAKAIADSRIEGDKAAQRRGDTPYHSINPKANKLRPKCRECKLFFNYIPDSQIYVCIRCYRAISKDEIQYSPDNLNAKYIDKNKNKERRKKKNNKKKSKQNKKNNNSNKEEVSSYSVSSLF
jgi:hypothetical protein